MLLIALCLGCKQEKQNEAPQPITLGAVYNLTGGQAALDIPSSRGAELAIWQANDTGGVRGHRLDLLLKNGQANTDTLSPEATLQALMGIQNFPGVTGMISFAPDSRIPSKSVTIMEVLDGSQQFVEALIPRNIPAP